MLESHNVVGGGACGVDIKDQSGQVRDIVVEKYNTFPLRESHLENGMYTFVMDQLTVEIERRLVEVFTGTNGYNSFADFVKFLLAASAEIESAQIYVPESPGATLEKELALMVEECADRVFKATAASGIKEPRRLVHTKGHKPAGDSNGNVTTVHLSPDYPDRADLDKQIAQEIDHRALLITDAISQIIKNRTIVAPSSSFFKDIIRLVMGKEENDWSRMENVVLAFNDDEAIDKLGYREDQIPTGIDQMDDKTAANTISRFCKRFIPENSQSTSEDPIQLLFSFEARNSGSYAVYDTPTGRKIVYLPMDFDRSTEIGAMFEDDSVVRMEDAGKEGAGRGDARAIAKELVKVFYKLHGDNEELALKSAILAAEAASAGMHHSLFSNFAQHDLEDLYNVVIKMPLETAASDPRVRIFDWDETV